MLLKRKNTDCTYNNIVSVIEQIACKKSSVDGHVTVKGEKVICSGSSVEVKEV